MIKVSSGPHISQKAHSLSRIWAIIQVKGEEGDTFKEAPIKKGLDACMWGAKRVWCKPIEGVQASLLG